MAVRFISRRFHSGNSVHLQRRFDVPLFFVLVADYVRAVDVVGALGAFMAIYYFPPVS